MSRSWDTSATAPLAMGSSSSHHWSSGLGWGSFPKMQMWSYLAVSENLRCFLTGCRKRPSPVPQLARPFPLSCSLPTNHTLLPQKTICSSLNMLVLYVLARSVVCRGHSFLPDPPHSTTHFLYPERPYITIHAQPRRHSEAFPAHPSPAAPAHAQCPPSVLGPHTCLSPPLDCSLAPALPLLYCNCL